MAVDMRPTRSPPDTTQLLPSQVWTHLARRMKLSPREVQIARAVLTDRTEQGIALDLGMSPHTVHTHLDRLYRKLSVNSRVELVVRLACIFIELTREPNSPLPPLCGQRSAGHCPLCS
jgi:DNA-binding CsgD family transcriptional regulator